MYTVGDILPVEALEDGTNILIECSEEDGAKDIIEQLLTNDQSHDIILVIPEDQAEAVKDTYSHCLSSANTETVEYVAVKDKPYPAHVAIRFSSLLKDSGANPKRLFFHPLHKFLADTDLRLAYKCCNAITDQIKQRNYLGIFVIDPDKIPEESHETLSHLFSTKIRKRRSNPSGRELCIERDEQTTDWVLY